MRRPFILPLLSLLLFTIFTSFGTSLPLSVHKRWIVDDVTGERVKLTCAHWVAHAKPMLPEGLNKLPMPEIAAKIAKAGFNCVRLSYATYMFTRYANHTVRDTLDTFDMPEVVAAIEEHNPWVLETTHLKAYAAAVDALAAEGVMVIIDNHVSMPDWCCDNADENGFFGERHFNTDEWQRGLAFVANHFKGKSNVVAMDLRNELRGTHQNLPDWYKYVTQGANTIHKTNPNLLVIISGLNFDNDLSFLKQKPLNLNYTNKLVYEAHIYSFSGNGDKWDKLPTNWVCASVIDSMKTQYGFLISGESPVPLFISEFGYDMTGGSAHDNKFFPCFVSYAASVDLDWSLWSFGGGYYYRQGNVAPGETYGVMDYNWTNYRDSKFPEKFQLLQRIVQDPSSNLSKSYILFHPLTGKCAHVNGSNNELVLGDCKNHSRWSSEGNGSPITLKNSSLCLKAAGEALPLSLSKDCLAQESSWKSVSATGLHLATSDENGSLLCLENDPDSSNIVTRKCICIGDDDSSCLDNPQGQWFQLISTNV